MLRFILGHGFFQLVMLLLTLFYAKDWLGIKRTDKNWDEIPEQNREVLTVVFNLLRAYRNCVKEKQCSHTNRKLRSTTNSIRKCQR